MLRFVRYGAFWQDSHPHTRKEDAGEVERRRTPGRRMQDRQIYPL